MKEQLNKEYEKLKHITKDYAIHIDQLEEYHETIARIKELNRKIDFDQN